MALERYQAKRDFRLTPEPRGKLSRGRHKTLSFVVQKHAASHLHYDFRLELDGVLLSWAVPKGPSLDPTDKRLAMQVEDHPLEYGGFEGIIPHGQYGAGTVMLWDRGAWIPEGDARAGLVRGHLKFELVGEKLHGRWALVRTHGSKYVGKSGKAEAWLLIKEHDVYAAQAGDARIVDLEPDSVLSGRSIEEIARAREHVWRSDKSVSENLRGGALAHASDQASLDTIPGIRPADIPEKMSAMLAMLTDAVPTGDDWLHEVKYDGYRMLCRIRDGEARLVSRNGRDWTEQLRVVADAARVLPVREAWLDGEVCVVDAQGRSSFQALQNALADSTGANLYYFLFDLLFLDGYDLRNVALAERKRLLRQLLAGQVSLVRYSVDVHGSGAEFFRQACALGLEGVISKRITSHYAGGQRTREWLKLKCLRRQEMVIGGYTEPGGSRTGFGALLLGVYEDGKLRYAGKVGTGFDERTLRTLAPRLEALECEAPAFVDPPRGFEAKGAHWIRPELVAEVNFAEWSRDGSLRHASFQGLREDKKPTDVVREMPVEPALHPRKTARRTAAAGARDTAGSVAGVALSNADKLLFPESGLSKRDLAEYYEAVAEHMLPHLRERPLSLVRCPDGWQRECFYQKHADASVHAAVSRVRVPEGEGSATYFAANSLAALVGLVQWGALELHPWGARADRLNRPDRLIFDFDPDEAVAWDKLVEAVGLLRTLLGELGLEGFLKTTGGKGLHVVVPVRRTLDWAQAKGFTKAMAEFLARTFPDRFTAVMSKARRQGKIFIDYLRNAEGATAIAPYGLRARANAPVATPLAWDELDVDADVRLDHFNVRKLPARLRALREDPWARFALVDQAVTKAMLGRLNSG